MFRPVRTRLRRELEGDPSGWPKLLSIVAPVGYGKTVLMSQLYAHLRQSGEHCYWFGLNERHSSVDRVLSSLRIERAGPNAGFNPTQALLQGDDSIEQRVDQLIDLFAELPSPTTIFIDSLNSCIDELLGSFLDALIFRTSSSIRFVWSSTAELGINIGRAKLEGLVRQIGLGELGLSTPEIQELLGADLGERIGDEGVEAILRQTEGWPAAIRMAQIILTESKEPLSALQAFSGADEDVTALLKRQVLSQFTPQLQDFLLCLAQLHTFSLDLCRHAIGSADAESHLDYLLRRNVFMIPLDRNRRRYRLHGLFREYLLGESERQQSPQRRNQVLRAASEWSEQKQEWQDAIEYALAAEDLDAVARLLDLTAKVFVREQGDIQQYIVWVEQLLAANATIGWETHFWYVWALVFQRRYEYGLRQHERLDARYQQHRHDAGLPADLPLRIDHLRMCIDLFTDRLADAYQRADRSLRKEQPHDAYTSGSIGCIKSICLSSNFEFAQARQTMRIAQPILLDVGGPYTIGWISLIYGTLSVYEGDYASAYRDLMPGLARARRDLGEQAALYGTMACVGARIAVEMGLRDEARKLLITALQTAHNNVLVDTAACGFDAALKLWNGGSDELVSVSRLREVARGYPPRLSLMLSCSLIQRLLYLGEIEAAIAEADHIGLRIDRRGARPVAIEELSVPRFRELFTTTTIDLLIASHHFSAAETAIKRELPLARDGGRIAGLVDLELARASISMHLGDAASASKLLISALRKAARRRIVRPFQDRAEVITQIVDKSAMSAYSFALNEEREFFNELCGRMLESREAASDSAPQRDAAVGLVTAPTKREAELLSLMDSGLSNQQIANYSNISVTTIKWHQKNLYRKLDAPNRAAALARARALGLLSK